MLSASSPIKIPLARAVLSFIFPTSSQINGRIKTIIYTIFMVGIVFWILNYILIANSRHHGDEDNYLIATKFIVDWLLRREPTPSLHQVANAVVDNGWFMPGMFLVMVPSFLVDPFVGAGHHIWVWRLNAALFNLAIWVWTLRRIDLTLGPVFTIALLICPALIFGWTLFTATNHGDVPAGLLTAVAFAETYHLSIQIFRREKIDLRSIMLLEIIMISMVYLRGNAILIVFALHFFIFSIIILACDWKNTFRNVRRLAVGGCLFAAALAPWSILASSVIGAPVLTTTTLTLSLGITFGRANEICFGPCPGENTWREAVAFSRKHAQQTGVSELVAQKQMADYALRNATFKSYMKRVNYNFMSFISAPTAFFNYFLSYSKIMTNENTRYNLSYIVKYASVAIYIPFLMLLFAGNIAVISSRHVDKQIMSLCVKMFTLCIFVQPFVHPSHARYWPAFAPLMALSAAFLLYASPVRGLWWRDHVPDLRGVAVQPWVGTLFLVIQSIYAIAFCLIAALVWWFAP